jgi:hypothetical protein
LTELTVSCTPAPDGWGCSVTIEDGGSLTEHEVSVSREELARFGGPSTDVHMLVNASFRFLLTREPKEAILRRFAISEIERYFPDYPTQVGRRLSDQP